MAESRVVRRRVVGCVLLLCHASGTELRGQALDAGDVHWRVHPPVLSVDPERLPPSEHSWVAVKDPSVVRYADQWHLFCTLRKAKKGDGRIRIGHLAFDKWSHASKAKWTILDLTVGYHGAPQIFYFEPDQKWYLIYQAEDSVRGLKYGPCYSTNDDISQPQSWTRPKPLYDVPPGAKAGLDFWVICDAAKAHLFFTSLDGRMWRATTGLSQFPDAGWSKPVVALRGDIFEASHTYAIAGRQQFLTIVEAKADRRRYFKAYVATTLDGAWKPFADSRDAPFVGPNNVVNQADSWATSYSHGEFIRRGYNQKLEIEPTGWRLLFQGANDAEYRGNGYGNIPWQLGILELVKNPQ